MEGVDNLQRTVDDFKPEAWNFQATFKKNFNTKREKLVFMLVVPIILVIGLSCSGVATYLEVAHGKGWGVFEVAQFSIVHVLVSVLIICASLANLRRLQKSQKTASVQNLNRWVKRVRERPFFLLK